MTIASSPDQQQSINKPLPSPLSRDRLVNLVFIDSAIAEYEVLLRGLLPTYQAFILSADQDGVEQITYLLSEFEDVESLHIVSHGSSASLKLGAASLHTSNLDRYAKAFGKWSQFLAREAQVLLYGCCVAEGCDGIAFLRKLREITGVAIAASSTLTGHAAKGGNWQLDTCIGSVNLSPIFEANTMQNFSGTLNNADLSALKNGEISADILGLVNSSTQASIPSPAQPLSGNNLLFIDSAIDDYEYFVAAAKESEVFILDSNQDGITQISSILASGNYTDIASLQIVSHGSSGTLELGNSIINLTSLSSYEDELTGWSQYLHSEADILLYGCNVAEGAVGQSFINQLSSLTGADIAASVDLTGSYDLGGDGDLESFAGNIEANALLDADALISFDGLLVNEYDLQADAAFQKELVIGGLNEPMDMVFLPDGQMLFIQKNGIIQSLDPNATNPTPEIYMDISSRIKGGAEAGLLNIVLDPDFETNNYFYIYYSQVDTGKDDPDVTGDPTDSPQDEYRVTRFTHDPVNNAPVAGSEFIVYRQPGIVRAHHDGGGLSFGPDGKLYITIGDMSPSRSADPTYDVNQVQDLTYTYGKVMRINKDGTIPQDNPYVDGPGGNLDEIWALGLRNPFRAVWDIQANRFYIADVGGNDQPTAFEEINLGKAGANYGWPYHEGSVSQSDLHPALTSPDAVGTYTNPLFAYDHTGQTPNGGAIIAGTAYYGNQFPEEYSGAFFFGDYVLGWVRYLQFDTNGDVIDADPSTPEVDAFNFDSEAGTVVAIDQAPDGSLYYTAIYGNDFTAGTISRITYNLDNQLPTIESATASVTEGPGPLTVDFSGVATDGDNDPLTYTWFFGDGTSATGANVSHTYDANGVYNATLQVSDGKGVINSNEIEIQVGIRPQISTTYTINGLTPTDNLFRAGDVVVFDATGSTDADGVPSDLSYLWDVDFIHNAHTHPFSPDDPNELVGSTFTFVMPDVGHGYSDTTGYKFVLEITDANGLTDTQVIEFFPEEVNLGLSSNVPGEVSYQLGDEAARSGPILVDQAINFQQKITVPQVVNVGGVEYTFNQWLNGTEIFDTDPSTTGIQSTASFTLVIPETDIDLTADYIITNVSATANDDNFVADEDAVEAALNVLNNDVDPDGDPLNITGVTAASNGGTVIVNTTSDGLLYTPGANFTGVETFTYTISDGSGDTSQATVKVAIRGSNDMPTASADLAAVGTNTVDNTLDVLANDTDPDVSNNPPVQLGFSDYAVVERSDINANRATLVEHPVSGGGLDNIDFVFDPTPANGVDPHFHMMGMPVEMRPGYLTQHNAGGNGELINFTMARGDGQAFAFEGFSYTSGMFYAGSNGSFTVYGTRPDGSIISQTFGSADTEQVFQAVTLETPEWKNVTSVRFEGSVVATGTEVTQELNIDDIIVGAASDVLTIASVDASSVQGTVAINSTGDALIYTPTAGFEGTETFTYTIEDLAGAVSTASVTVNVTDGPVTIFNDSFETDLPGTALPTGWTGSGWTVKTTTGEFDDVAGDFAGADGSNLIEANGNAAIYRSINLTGYENSDLLISILANDAGGADTTLEAGDFLYIEYSFGNVQPSEAEWNTAISAEGDIAPGSDSGMLTLTSERVSINPAGATTLWLRVRQHVNSGVESFVVDDLTVEAISGASVGTPNQAPMAVSDTTRTAQDTAVTIDVLGNDSDPDADDVLFVDSVTQGISGSVTNNGNSVTYTPDAGFAGTDAFTYTISDGNGGTSQSTVTVTVEASGNTAPVAVADSFIVDEDTTANVLNVLGNDTDADNDVLNFVGLGDANGSEASTSNGGFVSLNSPGTAVLYTPATNFIGTDTFTYTVSDGNGGENVGEVTVTVENANNDAPIAAEDAFDIVSNSSGSILDVLDNDTDPDSDDLTIDSVTQGAFGSVTNNGGSNITYIPNSDYVGSDTFIYTVSDGKGGTDTVTVNINVVEAPTSGVIFRDSFESDLPGTITPTGWTGSGWTVKTATGEFDGSSGTFTNVDGTNILEAEGDVGIYRAINIPGYETADLLISLLANDAGGSDTTLEAGDFLNVDYAFGINQPSEADWQTAISAEGDIAAGNDTGMVFLTSEGVSINPNGATVLWLRVRQNVNSGAESFAIDNLTVEAVFDTGNAAPTATSDNFSVTADSVVVPLDVLANDIDLEGDSLIISAVGTPNNGGSVSISADGLSLEYTPATGYAGTETFVYTIEDGQGNTGEGTVTIMVEAAASNAVPDAVDDAIAVSEDTVETPLDVLANDSDLDGDPLTIIGVGAASNGGVVTINSSSDGLLYTPEVNFVGTETFTYMITDSSGRSDTANVTVTVNNINDTPIALVDMFNIATNSQDNVLDVIQNDSDIDGDSLTITAVGPTSHGGTVSIDTTNNTLTYTPVSGFIGTETFEYTIQDVAGVTATTTVTIEALDGPVILLDESFETDLVGTTPTGWTGSGWTVKTAAGEFNDVSGDFTGTNGANLIEAADNGQIYRSIDLTGYENDDLLISLLANDGGGADTTLEAGDFLYVEYAFGATPPNEADWNTAISAEGDIVAGSDTTMVPLASDGVVISPAGASILWLRVRQVVNSGVESFAVDNIKVEAISATSTANQAPTTMDDVASTRQDKAFTINVLGNDSDPDGDLLTVESLTQGTLGSVVINTDNTLTYTPDTGVTGTDSFTYLASDGNGGTSEAAVTVEIISGAASTPGVIFADSFEADAVGTVPPTGWTGTGWTVKTAADEFNDIAGDFTSADGAQILEGGGDGYIYRSIDLTGHESSNLLISLLANDGGGADTTLEAGDFLYLEYAFSNSADTPPIESDWSTAISAEGDIAAGNDTMMQLLTSDGLVINPMGASYLWVRIRQDVNSGAEFFAIDSLIIETL